MNKVTFDGKWSFEDEWKQSSLNTYYYDDDNKQIILRSAHQDNFIYVFLDPINDNSLNTNGDYAIICFDTKNNKSVEPDSDDYCFMVMLGETMGSTYRGGSSSSQLTGFEKIPNHMEYISISSVSDNNDRYTLASHPSYEFKIPTDLIDRSSVYGFYFQVYNEYSNSSYTYPENLKQENFVPSPSYWGEIYSPDKSLPEFNVPLLILLPIFGLVVILTRNYSCKLK